MPLEIDVTDTEGKRFIVVKGEVDLYTSPELRAVAVKKVPKGTEVIGVDLSQVAYMDSSGVATLVEAMKSATKGAKAFVLVSPSEAVAKVLKGGAERALLARLKRAFRRVKHVKPPASRSESAEAYVVALGFRGGPADAPADASQEAHGSA